MCKKIKQNSFLFLSFLTLLTYILPSYAGLPSVLIYQICPDFEGSNLINWKCPDLSDFSDFWTSAEWKKNEKGPPFCFSKFFETKWQKEELSKFFSPAALIFPFPSFISFKNQKNFRLRRYFWPHFLQ